MTEFDRPINGRICVPTVVLKGQFYEKLSFNRIARSQLKNPRCPETWPVDEGTLLF